MSLPTLSMSLFASRGGAAKRTSERYWPLLSSALEYTRSVLPSVWRAFRYSTSVTVSANGLPGLRTASLAARISWALGAAAAHGATSHPATRHAATRHATASPGRLCVAQRIDDVHLRAAARRPPGRDGRDQHQPEHRA